MGGPRDRTPPKLLLATPLDQTRNFKATAIRLDFDEYFKLSGDRYQEITISPAMEHLPEYKIKQKSLVINFKDTLQKNTTYVINFGKAIVDVNEGNVLKNFTYVFSTGQHIDSLSVSGSVTNTQTQERDRDATVMLFSLKQDSLLFGKKKPTIYTSTDSSGNFNLGNLHEGDYRIYALKETSPNKIYDNENELIAFQRQPIHVTKDTGGIKLSLFKQEPEKYRVLEKKFDVDGKLVITLNKALNSPGLRVNYPPALNDQKIVDFGTKKDTALVYFRTFDFDSVSVAITNNGKVVLDSITRIKSRSETFKRNISLSYNISGDGRLKPGADLRIAVNSPVDAVDASRIILQEDSVSRTNFTITPDSVNKREFVLKYKFRQDARYQLAFNEGSFINIYKETNKRLVKNFILDKPENFGSVGLKITVPEAGKNYIIEWLNEQKHVLQTNIINKNTSIVYNGYTPGRYRVRVTYDDNANGKWDSGNVRLKTYPEQIFLSTTSYNVRGNFEDSDNVLEIPKETVNP